MAVKKGYKQTEVGSIPEAWSLVRLKTLLKCSPSYGVNAPAVAFDFRLPTYIRITDIDEHGRFLENTKVSVSHPDAEKYLLAEGDVVLARTGASVGKTYRYKSIDGVLVYAGFLICVRPDPLLLNSEYFFHLTHTLWYWNWVRSNSMRSGQPGINGSQYSSLPIPLPPTLREQEAIANALSDADAWIESLEQLIAKKRQIKQGAMQELLTGKRRLPGFSGKWEAKKLGDLGSFLKGSGVRKNEANSGDIPCVRYGEIYTHHNDYIRRFNSSISSAVAEMATRLNYGDLLFAGSGETKAEIGKCVAYAHDMEAYAGGDIVILRSIKSVPVFMGYYCNTRAIAEQKAARGQGDAVVHISASALAGVQICVPEIHEQTAIATVLSDMDTEIESLESKLAKAREVKQGMMQELLTGRIRLV